MENKRTRTRALMRKKKTPRASEPEIVCETSRSPGLLTLRNDVSYTPESCVLYWDPDALVAFEKHKSCYRILVKSTQNPGHLIDVWIDIRDFLCMLLNVCFEGRIKMRFVESSLGVEKHVLYFDRCDCTGIESCYTCLALAVEMGSSDMLVFPCKRDARIAYIVTTDIS